MSHPELGKKLLDQVAVQVGSIAKIEAAPKLDGRNMIMVLAPDRRSGAQAVPATRPAAHQRATTSSTPHAATAASTPTIKTTEHPASPPPNGRAPGAAAPTTTAASGPGPAEET